MKRASIALIGAALMSGGAHAAAPVWIVGAWAQQGGYCASGTPIVFKADGSYRNSGGDLEGRWTLKGNALSLVFRETDMETGDVAGPVQRTRLTATRVSATEMTLDRARFRRCSPKGGAEPWHPGKRFQTR